MTCTPTLSPSCLHHCPARVTLPDFPWRRFAGLFLHSACFIAQSGFFVSGCLDSVCGVIHTVSWSCWRLFFISWWYSRGSPDSSVCQYMPHFIVLLQYSYLENPHGQRSLAGSSPWGIPESSTTNQLSIAQCQWASGKSPVLDSCTLVAVNSLMRVFWGPYLHISTGCAPQVKTLGHRV